jgi:HlyD family secretion protein
MRKRLLIVVVILASVGGGAWWYRSRAAAPAAVERPRTVQVVRGNLVASVSSTGSLQPYAQVEVRSRATGTVIELRVQEGDRVTRGQLLAVIDDRDARTDLARAEAQYAAAVAQLQQSRSQLAATRAQNIARVAQAESALATARARLAQLLAGSRQEEIAQALEAQRQAELAVEFARQNLDRHRDLFNAGLIARSVLDQVQNQYDVAQAQLRATQSRVQQLRAGNRPEDIAIARAQVREAEDALAQARAARLQEAVQAAAVATGEAQVRTARAQVQQARDRAGETRVTATIAGVVSKLAVQAGQSVIGGTAGGGTLLMTLADVRSIQGNINVDESDVAQITLGMPVRITADALPGRTFNGKVVRIAPQSVVVQNVTQYTVIVELENPAPALRLGMSVDAEFIIMERRNVLLVPSEAVHGKDAKVVILVEGETERPVVVETGATDGRQVEITKGLEDGDVVSLGRARQTTGNNRQQPASPFFFPARPGGGRR